jgi:hypothetical protein
MPPVTLPRMQTLRSASVPLLRRCVFFCAAACFCRPLPAPAAATPKSHTVTLGSVRRMPYLPAGALAPTSSEDVLGLKIRPPLVDGRQKEWTAGDAHDVTDRSFMVCRALRLNDSLSGDALRAGFGSSSCGCSLTAPLAGLRLCMNRSSIQESPRSSGSATTPPAAASPPRPREASWPSCLDRGREGGRPEATCALATGGAPDSRLPARAMAAPTHAGDPAADRRPTHRLRCGRIGGAGRRGRERRSVMSWECGTARSSDAMPASGRRPSWH